MTGQTIACPNCRTAFKLDESLAAPLLEAGLIVAEDTRRSLLDALLAEALVPVE